MAETTVKPLKTSAAQEKFVSAGKKTGADKPKRPQAKKLSDTSDRYIKLGLYGDYGTGKTFALADLIEKYGLKVLVLSTDIGGDGLNSLIAELKRRGRSDLVDTHVRNLTLDNYDDVADFLQNPEEFFPEIYEWDPDLIAWDGFSNFQQNHVSDYVMTLDTVFTREGDLNTQKYWGEIRSATSKNLNRFFYMSNTRTGRRWHKFVTMLVTDVGKEEKLLEATTEAERQKVKKEVKAPYIQGSAAKLLGPAFDFFARTDTKRVQDGTTEDGKTKFRTDFVYHVAPSEKQKAKVRGVQFPPIIPGNMGEVWGKLIAAYMVTPEEIKAEGAV